MSQEFTFSDVSEHTSKKDLYMVIHDKVYNCTSFVDEHPGGEEVLLDVGGQDSTEAFEDVGHSDEAREILEGLLVGTLKRGANDPPAKAQAAPSSQTGTGSAGQANMGVGLYAALLFGGGLAFFAYQWMASQNQQHNIKA